MSLFELRQWRFPAWLGILAFAMIFLAPPVSQSLRNSHHVQMASHHSLSAMASMPAHHNHHAPPAIPTGGMGDMGMDHAACGYCVLLSYLPLLTLSGRLQPVHAVWLSHRQPINRRSFLPPIASFLSPLPRSPPQSLSTIKHL
ncbi:DUF2946 domain-containing protein [Dickeya sp. ws52]|uniref:DUF2946 domain-containing protein n=1 Tax=Dickeya sp. ws52 TaxID=2576377 RepID=UPI00117E694A|nr:DUF2946 domain-containing protein [Dickeya sp. ws52]